MRFVLLSLLAAGPLVAAEVNFNRDVRPIFSDKCFTCHGPDAKNRLTPLRLDTQEGARGAITPGKPNESSLYERIASTNAAKRMPPSYAGHDPLSKAEIATIHDWIEQGAEWQGHWSFIAPKRPQVPGGRNAIDYFIEQKLVAEGLQPTAAADNATVIRRLTLDLTGLPPTLEEIDAFLSDDSPSAYEKVVDRLLASPHYGERMAYEWLDAARYADTNGYQNDQERYMWRWRDWVIYSFNRNQPFDEFTVEQIAGDLLPNATRSQIIATGFNRNHRGNGELGAVPEEYHVEYVVDRVETTFTVWQGLTMGCARCHDHKYDPISQKEFFQLYAYFNNVPDRGRYFKYGNTPPFIAAPTEEQEAELAELDAKLSAATAELKRLEPQLHEAQTAWEKVAAENEPFDWSFDERLVHRFALQDDRFDGERIHDAGNVANFGFFDHFTLAARIYPEAPTGGIITRYKPNISARGNKGYGLFLVDGKLQMRLDSSDIDDRVQVETKGPIPLGRWQHVAATYDGSRLAKGIRIYLDGKPQPLRVIIDHSNNDPKINAPLRLGHGPNPEDRFRGRVRDARVYDRALSKEEAAVVAVTRTLDEIARSQDRTPAEATKLRWAFRDQYAPEPARKAWDNVRRLRLERESLERDLPTVMVMAEIDPPRETHMLNRGAYDAPGEKVTPALPSVLPPMPSGVPNNRLGLARWLVDERNPLTARVTVNRFWQMLFGTGLVKTSENFGSQGEWPSHPQLLDWLAVEFRESCWDVKRLLKLMVTSAAYRRLSKATPELLDRDPENRLLARGPRTRLNAEAIRDQAMAVSGLLNEAIGGPSVKPYQPAGLWKELSNAGKYEHDEGDDLYRRGLYTFWKRTIGPPAMLNFDAAARETCVVRRSRTNTPLQALNLMNDVTFLEASRVLAERMMREGGSTPDERFGFGFRLATARPPTAVEGKILRGSFQRYLDRYRTYPADAESYLKTGEHPLDKTLDTFELAAYAAVASLILNLDETITKR